MSRSFPFRELVPTCRLGTSFRYYLEREKCGEVWKRLEENYGDIRRNEVFKTMEIEAEYLHFKATFQGNPIHVIRKRGCTEHEILKFHKLIELKDPKV